MCACTLLLTTLSFPLNTFKNYQIVCWIWNDLPWIWNTPRSPLNFWFWGFLKSKVYGPRPATLNQLQANISREVAQIDPDMMKRTMLDMRERAVKWIAAGEGRFEKKSSNQLYPCLVTDRSLMRSWRNVVQNGYLCRSYAANYNYIETHCPIKTQLDLSKQKSYWISHQPEKYFPQLISTKLSFFWDTLYHDVNQTCFDLHLL